MRNLKGNCKVIICFLSLIAEVLAIVNFHTMFAISLLIGIFIPTAGFVLFVVTIFVIASNNIKQQTEKIMKIFIAILIAVILNASSLYAAETYDTCATKASTAATTQYFTSDGLKEYAPFALQYLTRALEVCRDEHIETWCDRFKNEAIANYNTEASQINTLLAAGQISIQEAIDLLTIVLDEIEIIQSLCEGTEKEVN